MALKSTHMALSGLLKIHCAYVFSLSVMSYSLLPHRLQPNRLLLSIEFFRRECWSDLTFLIPGDLPDRGLEPASSALAGRFLLLHRLGSPRRYMQRGKNSKFLMLTFRAKHELGNTLLSCFSSLTIDKYPVSALFTAIFFAFCTFCQQFSCLKQPPSILLKCCLVPKTKKSFSSPGSLQCIHVIKYLFEIPLLTCLMSI